MAEGRRSRYSMYRITMLFTAIVDYRHSLPMVILITGVGAQMAYLFSHVVAKYIMGFEDAAMVGGMLIVLQLCSSFPQFSGNQECYTARQNYTTAITALKSAVIHAQLGGFIDELCAAVAARRRMARGDTVEVFSTRDSDIAVTQPYVYDGSYDADIMAMATTEQHAADAMLQLSAFDAVCVTSAPDTLVQPVFVMFLLNFGFVMPLTLYPAMGWWYILFSFPATFICVSGFNALCDAGNILNPDIKEYAKIINLIMDSATRGTTKNKAARSARPKVA